MKGRPPLENISRDKDGKSTGRTYSSKKRAVDEGIHPETLAVRERQLEQDGIILSFHKIELGREILKRTAEDRLSGFTLGRLLLRYRQDKSNPGAISESQFEAGEAWHRIVRRHAQIHGYKLSIRTPSFVMVSFGHGGSDPSEEDITHIREQWKACYDAVVARGLAVRNILYGVVVEDWPMERLTEDDYGFLRDGLNAVGKALR